MIYFDEFAVSMYLFWHHAMKVNWYIKLQMPVTSNQLSNVPFFDFLYYFIQITQQAYNRQMSKNWLKHDFSNVDIWIIWYVICNAFPSISTQLSDLKCILICNVKSNGWEKFIVFKMLISKRRKEKHRNCCW